MLGSSDYQEVNHKYEDRCSCRERRRLTDCNRYRLGALKDTCILCTMEIDDDGELAGGKGQNKL